MRRPRWMLISCSCPSYLRLALCGNRGTLVIGGRAEVSGVVWLDRQACEDGGGFVNKPPEVRRLCLHQIKSNQINFHFIMASLSNLELVITINFIIFIGVLTNTPFGDSHLLPKSCITETIYISMHKYLSVSLAY